MRPPIVSRRETCLCTEFIWDLLRDPRKTQPWIAMQVIWHWSHPSCLRTILWGGFLLGAQFSHPEDCGMRSLSRTRVQLWVWRSSLEDTNSNSGKSSEWLCLHVLCRVISAAAPSPFEYPEPPASRWFQAQLQSKTSEGVCLFRQRDFPGFPGFLYCQACRAQTIPPYSQLSHLMPCSCPEMAFGFLNELSGIECP